MARIAAGNIGLVLVVAVFAVSVTNTRSAKILDTGTSRNCSSAIESVNNVVNELINQTSFIISASTSNTSLAGRANLTSGTPTTEKATVVTEQAVKPRKGILMGLWGRESTTTTAKEPSLDSQEDDDDDEEDVSEEESDASSDPELIGDPRNDSSADRATSQDVPNFHFSIKISHDDAYNVETLALRAHLNRTIEKLREFNDRYEKLIEENKTIRKDLRELKNSGNSSSGSWRALTTNELDDDTNEATTTSIRLESTDAATTVRSEANKRTDAVRFHLLV